MAQTLKKWGNSLSLRIPRACAAALHWVENTDVEVRVDDAKLVVEAVAAPRYTLDALLAGMTEGNMPGEISTGAAVGNELW